jgi:predicted dehydrogenase
LFETVKGLGETPLPELTFRWGILGPGSIANKFAIGLQSAPNAKLEAIGSRTLARAQEFATKYGAEHAFGSYEELAEDSTVDAIYIATPHPYHCENALMCLSHKKAVLCEKPFTINASQASLMISAARRNDTFLMEAMWSRFFPLMSEFKEIVVSGAIGEPRMMFADFGFRAGFDPASRLFNPELGGGGLLDVGVYPLSLASFLFGKPGQVTGLAEIGETGIDEQAAFVMKYNNGVIATLACGVRTSTPHEALVIGTEGSVKIAAPFWIPTKLILKQGEKPEQIIEQPLVGNGYQYQAFETEKRVRNGELQSPILPWDETLEIMKTMDALRAQWGIKYPGE